MRILAVGLAAAIGMTGSVALLAHDMTFKGTVRALEGAKLEVQVIDEKTRKESPMTFELTAKTRIYRGDREVKIADAAIRKDERIVVTVNHDVSATQATIVRLGPASAF